MIAVVSGANVGCQVVKLKVNLGVWIVYCETDCEVRAGSESAVYMYDYGVP